MQLSRRQALSSLGAALALPCLSHSSAAWPASRSRLLAAGDPGPFLAAVRAGELDRVRRLLAEDAALARASDATGRSAYVLAHVHGHADVAVVLRETGLELDPSYT